MGRFGVQNQSMKLRITRCLLNVNITIYNKINTSTSQQS